MNRPIQSSNLIGWIGLVNKDIPKYRIIPRSENIIIGMWTWTECELEWNVNFLEYIERDHLSWFYKNYNIWHILEDHIVHKYNNPTHVDHFNTKCLNPKNFLNPKKI